MNEKSEWLTEEEQNYLNATGYSRTVKSLIVRIEENDPRAKVIFEKIKDQLFSYEVENIEKALKENNMI